MASTLFARGDSAGVVRLTKLFILWHMVNNKQVNTGYFLAQHLSKHATQPTGDIVVGGMVTAIADYLGLTQSILSHEKPVSGGMKLDLDACVQFRMLKLAERGYQLMINGQFSILLPDPARTGIENRENWVYNGGRAGNAAENEHDNDNVVEEQQQGGVPGIQQDEVMVENDPADMPLWMERFSRFEEEQARQSMRMERFEEEQKRQGEMLSNLSTMMSALYTQFSAQPPSDP